MSDSYTHCIHLEITWHKFVRVRTQAADRRFGRRAVLVAGSVPCRLVELIQQYGVRRWSFLATQLHTGRLGKQSRERWYNHLDPAINKGPWTRAKDDAIVTAYEEMGSKWAEA